jgi:hypothetical protein
MNTNYDVDALKSGLDAAREDLARVRGERDTALSAMDLLRKDIGLHVDKNVELTNQIEGLKIELEDAGNTCDEALTLVAEAIASRNAWKEAHRVLVDAITSGVLAKQVADGVKAWREPPPFIVPKGAAPTFSRVSVVRAAIKVEGLERTDTDALVAFLKELGVGVLG